MCEIMLSKFTNALKARPLAAFCAVTLAFIVLKLYFNITVTLLTAFAVCALLIALNVFKRINNFLLIFISLAVFLGTFSAANTMARNEKIISALDSETVRMTGRVASFPTSAGNKQRFYFKTTDIIFSGGEFNRNFKIYVSCDDANIKYGDILTMNAKLVYPDFQSYDISRNILAKGAPMTGSCRDLLGIRKGRFPWSMISKIRDYLLSASDSLYGDAKGLFRALTTGEKSLISSKGYGEFSSSGIAHIACISGLHVSIIGMAVYNLLCRINKSLGAALSVCAVFLFAAISGGTPSSLRAAMMYTLFIVSDIFIRQNDRFTSLFLSAAVLALFNPYIVFDMGFILSYLSVLGMQIFSFRIKAIFRFLPKGIAESVVTTISAQMLTMPIILIYFKTLSVYSVFANIIISFIFPVTLYMCFIMAATAFIPVLSLITCAVCQLCLGSVCAVAHLFASLPFGSAETDKFGAAAVICYAVTVLLLIFSEKLSSYVLGSAVIGCALVLAVVSTAGKGVQYSLLSDNSTLISSNGVEVAVICDGLNKVSSELTESASPHADILLFGDCGKITAGEISEMLNITGAYRVCLPEGEAVSTVTEARRAGAEVLFYPETVTDLLEYAEANFL